MLLPDNSLWFYHCIYKWAMHICIIIIFLSLHQVQEVPALHCTKLTEAHAFWNCVLALCASVVTMITCTLQYYPSIGQAWYLILSYLFAFIYPHGPDSVCPIMCFCLFVFPDPCFYPVSSFPSPQKSLITNLVMITEDRILYFSKVLSRLISQNSCPPPLIYCFTFCSLLPAASCGPKICGKFQKQFTNFKIACCSN